MKINEIEESARRRDFLLSVRDDIIEAACLAEQHEYNRAIQMLNHAVACLEDMNKGIE